MTNHPNRSKQHQPTHTPGPWTVHYEPNARDEPGATFVLLEANDRFDTNEANARLIAAAPELLAALKAIDASPACPSKKKREQVRAAVAKAEGR